MEESFRGATLGGIDECPVAAIFPEYDIPAEWASFIEKNAAHFRK